jgi:hypothetical protein
LITPSKGLDLYRECRQLAPLTRQLIELGLDQMIARGDAPTVTLLSFGSVFFCSGHDLNLAANVNWPS